MNKTISRTATAFVAAAAICAGVITAPSANAAPRCMNYLWYSACNDNGRWQLCNFNNDGQCHDLPNAPWPGGPFDPIQ